MFNYIHTLKTTLAHRKITIFDLILQPYNYSKNIITVSEQ